MLYNLLLVDDEKIIRDGLEKAIDWSSIGFKIIGKASDGKCALEFIASNQVDVVLTDIRMPSMTGIELSEILAREHPEIKVLILSGYSEFEYARSAIAYGVCGYILKPSKEDELSETFTRVLHMLEEQHRLHLKNEAVMAVTGTILDERNGRRILQFFSSNADKAAGLLLIQAPPSAEKPIGWRKDICSIIHETLELHKIVFTPLEYEVCVLLLAEDEYCIKNTCKKLHETLANRCPERTVFSLSDVFHDADGLPDAYTQARSLSRHSTYIADQQLFTSALDCDACENAQISTNAVISGVIRSIMSGRAQDIDDELAVIFSNFVDMKITNLEVVFGFAYRLFFLMEDEFARHVFNCEKVLEIEENISLLRKKTNIEDIRNELSQQLYKITQLISKNRVEIPDRFVRSALDIINKHYSDLELSLRSVARNIAISPAYLSRLFKKHMDVTFTQYLMDYRTEKSKKLLEDVNNKVYEVALMVGYSDQRYFSEIFRGKTGLTPVEYRCL